MPSLRTALPSCRLAVFPLSIAGAGILSGLGFMIISSYERIASAAQIPPVGRDRESRRRS